MRRRWLLLGLAAALGVGWWNSSAPAAKAQGIDPNRFYHYPYYFFPHNYWPAASPAWPEPIGTPYRPPPAYMAFPPFREPHWRYEWWQPQSYYRGFHFWLDQF